MQSYVYGWLWAVFSLDGRENFYFFKYPFISSEREVNFRMNFDFCLANPIAAIAKVPLGELSAMVDFGR